MNLEAALKYFTMTELADIFIITGALDECPRKGALGRASGIDQGDQLLAVIKYTLATSSSEPGHQEDAGAWSFFFINFHVSSQLAIDTILKKLTNGSEADIGKNPREGCEWNVGKESPIDNNLF